jgi:2-polyprenyl-6-methoxyphenol hydroxylase-like FAD-dependent oxidoreductase
MTSTSPHYDVIIAGAGPVGLFLACELALARCTVLVLEKAADPDSPLKRLPFGMRGLSSPSIEALYRRGLLDELQVPKKLEHPFVSATGTQVKRQAGHFAGIPFHRADVDVSQWPWHLPGATPTNLLAEMAELEAVLARRAHALGVQIRRGLAVTKVDQAADDVSVHAGGQAFTGRWLVGCDGARSAVRKAGNFEFAGTEPEFTGYTVKADLVDPAQIKIGRTMTPAGMVIQFQPGHLALGDFDGGAAHDAGRPITREHVQAALRRVSGTDATIAALHLATTWTDRARQATAYRDGRILLAGDAAHIHSPLGGQGLNLGLGDAMNLGWKLAATVHGTAPAGLLDTYHAERHPVGARVLDWSRAQVAIMRPEPAARALNAVIRDLMDTRDGATYVAGRVWGIDMRYDLGGDHPLAGRSVPDFVFDDGTTMSTTMSTAMRDGRAILLDVGADAALAAFARRYGGRMTYVSGAVRDALGASALLVRPDGIVAWACGGPPDRTGLAQAAARWFGGADVADGADAVEHAALR